MKIEADGEEKIAVTLSHEDMHELDITYDEMDYSNIETRRVIWTVLDEAKRVLGKTVNTDGRLLVQVSPADDGGCLMLFTQLPPKESKSKKRLIMKKDAEPLLFFAFDSNAFIDGIKILKDNYLSVKSFELFMYQNDYYIIVHTKPTFSEALEMRLCEFGEIQTNNKKFVSEIYEYGTCISAK